MAIHFNSGGPLRSLLSLRKEINRLEETIDLVSDSDAYFDSS